MSFQNLADIEFPLNSAEVGTDLPFGAKALDRTEFLVKFSLDTVLQGTCCSSKETFGPALLLPSEKGPHCGGGADGEDEEDAEHQPKAGFKSHFHSWRRPIVQL